MVDDGSTDGTAAWRAAAWRRGDRGAAAAGGLVRASPGPATSARRRPPASGCCSSMPTPGWHRTALGRLLAAHDDAVPGGLLSVQPHHVVERPYEQLSAVCNTVPVLASGMAAVRPRRSARVAFGPCLLTRAADLAAVGGFEAVAGAGGGGRRAGPGLRRAPAAGCGASPVATPCRSACTPTGGVPWSKGGRRTSPVGRPERRWLPLLGAVAVGERRPGDRRRRRRGSGGRSRLPTPPSRCRLWWMLRRLGSFHPLAAVLFPVPLLAFTVLFLWSSVARVPAPSGALARPRASMSAAGPSGDASCPSSSRSASGARSSPTCSGGRSSTPVRATPPTGSRPDRLATDGWLLRVRPFEPTRSTAGCGSGAGRTGSRRPAPSSPAGQQAAPPRLDRGVRARDPPRRARPLVGPGRQPRVRAVEPTERSSASWSSTAWRSTHRSSPSSATTARERNASSRGGQADRGQAWTPRSIGSMARPRVDERPRTTGRSMP